MSEPQNSSASSAGPSREETLSALFANLVVQQANMAMMLLGKVVHPETGEAVKDLEAARLFIDQLEMLEVKTKGNLTKEETDLLKQSLMSLRMAFVEAVNASSPSIGTGTEKPAEAKAPEVATPPPQEESHKKFTKKY